MKIIMVHEISGLYWNQSWYKKSLNNCTQLILNTETSWVSLCHCASAAFRGLPPAPKTAAAKFSGVASWREARKTAVANWTVTLRSSNVASGNITRNLGFKWFQRSKSPTNSVFSIAMFDYQRVSNPVLMKLGIFRNTVRNTVGKTRP